MRPASGTGIDESLGPVLAYPRRDLTFNRLVVLSRLTLSGSGRIITMSERKHRVAENDKFERSLPRYWSKAHRLACANSSIPAIVDEITTGARLTLGREASCRAICQLADLLQQLKPAEPTTAQTQIFGDWDYRHEYLEVQLEQLNEEYEQYPCMRIVAKAARAVFEKLDAPDANPNDDVQDLFAEEITTLLIDHRWLSRGRPRLQQQFGRTMDQQVEWEAQVAAGRHLTRRNVFHLTVPYSLVATVDAPVEERSQRARSFLFLTLGVIAAERVGADALFMCENGVGAINLPMDGTQVGTSNARAAHPTTLLRFNRLLASLIGDSVRVRNPFWDITKGEACRHDNLRKLGHAITETVSCDSFPLRIPATPQCGTCTSCLLRRVSLHAAGLQTFDTPSAYFRDVSRPNTPLRGKSLHPLQVMEWQFLRLRRTLNARAPWNNLCQAFPELHSAAASYQQLESTSFSTVTKRLLRLYARYTDEWERFPGRQHLATSIAA
jgi:7-cyano-7-deazaguanine synthase in queuosine biosynthesis